MTLLGLRAWPWIRARQLEHVMSLRCNTSTGRTIRYSSTLTAARQNTLEDAFPPGHSGRQQTWPGRLFVQPQPNLGNPFEQDAPLRNYLQRALPPDVFAEVATDLHRFGQRAVEELAVLHRQCELEPPYVQQFNAWGSREDDITTSAAWKRMHDISAEEGLVAIGYERKYGQYSRIYQVAKNYLFASTSGLYSCPLAMTDGAAKILEGVDRSAGPYSRAFNNLTSRDPASFWTSGQWMTERRGGSDVANGTETVAVPLEQPTETGGTHALFGSKWFSSATDSNMAFTLARVVQADGTVIPGTKGLSLFYVETRGPGGRLNSIEIVKMKNKLGTRQLPTAELTLAGTIAGLVGMPGKGVSGISEMLTMTRIHNAISAVSVMRRIIALSRDYATKRQAFGKLLVDHPLHMHTLAQMELEVRGALVLLFEAARLLGLKECGLADELTLARLRLITPLLKLYTAKQAVAVASEGLESFGGQGYIEDTGLPNILRDAQVLPIWEGTTNILSLDVVRALISNWGFISSLPAACRTYTLCQGKGTFPNDGDFSNIAAKIPGESLVTRLLACCVALDGWMDSSPELLQNAARPLAFSLAQVYIGALLLQQAQASQQPADRIAAARWCQRGMLELCEKDFYLRKGNDENNLILMEGYQAA